MSGLRGFHGFLNVQRLAEWAAVIAGFVIVRVVGKPTSWAGWLLLLLAAVLVAVPVILAAFREYQREREVASATDLATMYRSKLAVTLGDALTPLIHLLGRVNLAGADRRPALAAQLRQGVVDAACALCGGERVLVTFFALTEDALVPQAWAGRAEPPPVQPLAPKDRSARLIRDLVHRHGRLLIGDVRDRRAPLHLGEDGDRSLALAAVAVDDAEYGLLCAGSPDPDGLDPADLDILTTLAHLLGAGQAAEAHPKPDGSWGPQLAGRG